MQDEICSYDTSNITILHIHSTTFICFFPKLSNSSKGVLRKFQNYIFIYEQKIDFIIMRLSIFCECTFENVILLNFQGSISELISFEAKT